MPTTVSMRGLLETGVHFGHRTRKWNPKMKPYIFTERNGIHIIDLQQTLNSLNAAADIVRNKVADGGNILFVGTKRQAQETIMLEAQRCSMPYVNQRWLGGTLTNWRTISQRIDHLKELEARRDRGEFEVLTKKEALLLTREIDKLTVRLGGIRDMGRVPDLVFVIDIQREYTALREANILKIPIIALVDTNCDPDQIDHVIPSNDDAIRAIKLLTSTMATSVLEGTNLRKDDEEEPVVEITEMEELADGSDEALLGEATLAKLASGDLQFEGDRQAVKEDEKKDTDPQPAVEAAATDEPAEDTDEPAAEAAATDEPVVAEADDEPAAAEAIDEPVEAEAADESAAAEAIDEPVEAEAADESAAEITEEKATTESEES